MFMKTTYESSPPPSRERSVAQSDSGFLHELLQHVSSGVRLRRPSKHASTLPASQRLATACEALMGRQGEASRIALAEQALDAYAELDAAGKAHFFHQLLADYGAAPAEIRLAYAAWDEEPSDTALTRLFAAVEPVRQSLLRRLNLCPGGTLALLRMREDLLKVRRAFPELTPLDADFAHLFASWFNRGFLVMRRIDWNTSAAILEKIVAYEAVHEIRDWMDLRRRLDPLDRRCYGFFHPATGDEPLIFVEVALCNGIPDAIAPLLGTSDHPVPEQFDTAVFYSISNCQPGLKGVSFGNFLIKQVARDLSLDLPDITTFVTLSPAPGFAAWLAQKAEEDAEARTLFNKLTAGHWLNDDALRAELDPIVNIYAGHYFVNARNALGAPVDPVARFHLSNGASAHRINWPADFAPAAIERSFGLMINYLYELKKIEAQGEAFAREGTVTCGAAIQKSLRQHSLQH